MSANVSQQLHENEKNVPGGGGGGRAIAVDPGMDAESDRRFHVYSGLPRVREKSGKNKIFSKSGNCQRILKKCQGILSICPMSGNCQGILS